MTEISTTSWVALYTGLGVGLVGVLVAGATRLAGAIFRSVGPLPPTAAQLEEEQLDEHPLFRHLPALKGKVAWRQIGDYPTPIHSVTAVTPDGARIAFSVKREDLASAEYGGNKLRTLQHQLAACEAHFESHPDAVFSVVGSYGSNQCIATKLHGTRRFNLPTSSMEALQPLPDLPDLDNTLNLMSSLSLDRNVILAPFGGVRRLLYRLWNRSDKVFPPGGHNVAGVLGQIGACLELAEQIEAGETPDPTAIYLPYGSGCTTTGITMGVALSRHLGLKAFQSPDFKIVVVVVHHVFARLHRMFGALFWHRMPLSVSYSIDRVTEYLGSIDACPTGFRELCHSTREFLEIVTDPAFVGQYGSHSDKSLPAAQSFDSSQQITGDRHNGFDAKEAHLWLCGHFAAKPYAVMLERLNGGEHTGKNVLFWQTKSHVQPVKRDAKEAEVFEEQASDRLKSWATKGRSYSELRKGSWPDNYRHLMTEL